MQLPYTPDQARQLGVHNGETLYSSVRDERRLLAILAALDRLFDRCGETARYTDVCLRRWLRRRFPDRPYKSPFELVSKVDSERQYRKEMKYCLCFWLRTLQLSPPTARGIMRRTLSRSQREALSRLWLDPIWKEEENSTSPPTADQSYGESDYESDESEVEEDEEEGDDGIDDGDGKNELESDDDDSDAISSTRSSTNSPEVEYDDPTADAVLALCYYAVTEDFKDGRASSTILVYSSGLRGLLQPSGDQYLPPSRFTPVLSRLIYCSRLIFLEVILPRFPHHYIGLSSRPRYGQLKALNAARQEKMCEGTLSPMGEFLSLLSYGNALRRSQGPAYHFHWSDDSEVLSWDGTHHLTMENFRGLAREVCETATVRCKRLMYDWEPDDIDLQHIRDRISTTTPGYSFITDPANQLEGAYLELFMRACVSPIDGLLKMHTKDESTWDIAAAQSYLDAHDEFLKTLMVLMNLDGGQSARISELLTLEQCNGPSQQRGICIWGAKICSITRHHKARLVTNNEFYVARFFSTPVSRLIFRYLVYIRPLAQTILRKCFSYTSENTLLFVCLSQAGRRSSSWTTSTFTQELRRYCAAAPGVPSRFGAQLYRQVSIVITERHVRTAAAHFNRFDDITSHATEEVAYAWQSGHRPMQRHTTYGLDGAFPDHLQPSLLRIYARISGDWHAFLWGGQQQRSHVHSRIEELLHSLEAGADLQESLNRAADATLDNGDDGDDDMAPTAEPCLPITTQEDPSGPTGNQVSPMIGPFVHLAQLDLVVCTQCKCGDLAAQVNSHLLHPRHRRNFTQKQRHNIKTQVLNIPGIIKDPASLLQWTLPFPDTDPIPYIKPPMSDGLGCNACLYVVRGIQRMQEHCRDDHGWVNDWKRGGRVKQRAQQERLVPWRSNVRCQRIFEWGYRSCWFEVGRDRADSSVSSRGLDL
ncbi:hypothetical protein B0J13DRAFT_636782 [Dactylonectria estremocensis]|uniref:Uncharacterized protein n=1 Tax=Dactylonectria estremocensis TaxID=1079267 RepID=A0A9P9ES25_9HYPO|nr:hypothetical protein B0J13DRAFT_636782 [Dactylonectria estremocensis]